MMFTAEQSAMEFEARFPCANAFAFCDSDGNEWVVIGGTGDCDGGAFAYSDLDVSMWLESDESSDYSSFCAACDPESDADLAREVFAAEGIELYQSGICQPIPR